MTHRYPLGSLVPILSVLALTTTTIAALPAIVGVSEPRSFALNTHVQQAPTPISQVFTAVDASFITVHFSRFHLARGDRVLVRNPANTTVFTYTALGRGDRGLDGHGFFSSRIPGDTAVVEFLPSNTRFVVEPTGSEPFGFAVDAITRSLETVTSIANPLTICGEDNSRPAKCYTEPLPVNGSSRVPTSMYNTARAVARLLIEGTTVCTGWLIGNEGHLMTNYHCLSSATLANATDYEFLAESGSCAEECTSWLGCPGQVVATTATLVSSDETLDYALVQLNTEAMGDKAQTLLRSLGFLQLRVVGAERDEAIFVPQHTSGGAKRIVATEEEGDALSVRAATVLEVDGTSACGAHRVLYMADTQRGASGSPVVAAVDHTVVALHSCGVLGDGDGGAGCVNSGTDIRGIIWDLQQKQVVPGRALGDANANVTVPVGPWTPGVTPAPTVAPTPAPTSSVCGIFRDQVSCENTLPGRCTWVDAGCRPMITTPTPTTQGPTSTPEPPPTTNTPEPTATTATPTPTVTPAPSSMPPYTGDGGSYDSRILTICRLLPSAWRQWCAAQLANSFNV